MHRMRRVLANQAFEHRHILMGVEQPLLGYRIIFPVLAPYVAIREHDQRIFSLGEHGLGERLEFFLAFDSQENPRRQRFTFAGCRHPTLYAYPFHFGSPDEHLLATSERAVV